jgi:hypothetical protein
MINIGLKLIAAKGLIVRSRPEGQISPLIYPLAHLPRNKPKDAQKTFPAVKIAIFKHNTSIYL